jgi:hypothetical protein
MDPTEDATKRSMKQRVFYDFPKGRVLAVVLFATACTVLRWYMSPQLPSAITDGDIRHVGLSEQSDVEMKETTLVQRVPVFYSLFVKSQKDAPRVRNIVMEQFSSLLPEHEVYMHSIGVQLGNISFVTKHLGHHEQGTEIITLHSLWQYCSNHTDAKVVYLHAKGSSNNNRQNTALRPFLTVGALSRECLSLPATCDVCSSRISPIPHPHTPGNMWLARCSYINKLIDPNLFEAEMESVQRQLLHVPQSCVGRGRYAAEHWVLSHPSARPCDLCSSSNYVWSYANVPRQDFVRDLVPAPRFELPKYYFPNIPCEWSGTSAKERLYEYLELYNETPTASWWGWRFFNNSESTVSIEKLAPEG